MGSTSDNDNTADPAIPADGPDPIDDVPIVGADRDEAEDEEAPIPDDQPAPIDVSTHGRSDQ